MSLKSRVRLLLRRLGYDVQRYSAGIGTPGERRLRLLRHHQIDLLLDVGANAGQYARGLRAADFQGRIVSFEPLSAAYAQLAAAAAGDPRWDVVHSALGERDGEAEINIAQNSQSSSLLEMLPAHLETAPQSRYVGRELISIHRLDTVLPKYRKSGERVFLKVDAQGYEMAVLEGAGELLDSIAGVQLETALMPLYAGEVLMNPMVSHMEARGFSLMSLEPGFCNVRTGRLLQVDCIFFRE